MIRYTDTIADVTPGKLKGFFHGWPNPPSPEMHLRLLAGSDEIVLAIDDDTGNVVGFVTAITDGVLSAYIPFLEVVPQHQGQGIGHELVRRLMEKFEGIYMVDTVCDPELVRFYQEFGMQPGTAMIYRRHRSQAGE